MNEGQGVERQLNQYEERKLEQIRLKLIGSCIAAVKGDALEDFLLLIGEPGAGKSAVVSSAARELRRQQALSGTSSEAS